MAKARHERQQRRAFVAYRLKRLANGLLVILLAASLYGRWYETSLFWEMYALLLVGFVLASLVYHLYVLVIDGSRHNEKIRKLETKS